MKELFYFNINLDIGNMVQVVNEYTLIIAKNVMSITTQCINNTSLFESIDDNFRLLRVLRCLGGAVLSSILPYASTILRRVDALVAPCSAAYFPMQARSSAE